MIDYLNPGDALVVNDTRVIPARLYGTRAGGGACEVLLLKQLAPKRWETLVRPGKKLRPGAEVSFGDGRLVGRIVDNEPTPAGRIVDFDCEGTFEAALDALGEMPLPPYIHERLADPERYQTVYARAGGLRRRADRRPALHAGAAGAHPRQGHRHRAGAAARRAGGPSVRVKVENIEDHEMHAEFFEVTPESAERINAARARGGRGRRRGHDQRAHAGVRRRKRRAAAEARRDAHLHPPRPSLPDGRTR